MGEMADVCFGATPSAEITKQVRNMGHPLTTNIVIGKQKSLIQRDRCSRITSWPGHQGLERQGPS